MPNAAAPIAKRSDRSDAPLHVAVIMDGNGRWAAARGLPRVEGHRRGVEALRRLVRAANELGILYLTIFSFSSENWSRPTSEIGDLFGLLRRFIRNDLATLHRDGVRVRVIGQRDGLDPDICALLKEAEDLTRGNSRRRAFALGHDPVFAARPPNRRSRLAYSAIAPSSAALSKSGQCIGTNTSSL